VLVRFVNRGKVIVRTTYHSIPRATRNLAVSGTYLLGHGEARFGVAHLLVECPRPVVVAEHVELYAFGAELSGPVLDELQRAEA
jgi:hypothetical protein